MGAAIYWLANRLKKAENDKDELAKDVIKLTTLWEEKSDELDVKNEKLGEKNTKVNEEILVLLREIKMIVTKRGLWTVLWITFLERKMKITIRPLMV